MGCGDVARLRGKAGKSLGLGSARRLPGLRPAGSTARLDATTRPTRITKNTGADEVTSLYLPTTFTTLFLLGASLLLGYIL
jgi:hypothetical protein